MLKDMRNIVEDFEEKNVELSIEHQSKFQDKLNKELHSKKRSFKWLYMAASIVLLFAVAIQHYPTEIIEKPVKNRSAAITLGSLSPELKSIESYYKNTITYEISNLEVNDKNKEILDGYLAKIGELTSEYKSLTKELNTKGVNDEIINALINNLQLRLGLLQRLKKQLNDLKQLKTKQNEMEYL